MQSSVLDQPTNEDPIATTTTTSTRAAATLQRVFELHRQELQVCLQDWAWRQDALLAQVLSDVQAHRFEEEPPCDKWIGVLPGCPADTACFDHTEPARPTESLSTVVPRASAALSSHHPLASLLRGFEEPAATGLKDAPKSTIFAARGSMRKQLKQLEVVVDEHLPCPWLQQLEGSTIFQSIVAFVIAVNAFSMAYNAEVKLHLHTHVHADKDNTARFFTGNTLEVAFCCMYSLELIVRVSAHRCRFFYGDSCSWNYFDVFLALSGWQDVWSSLFGSKAMQNMTYLRVPRLFKALKLLRVVRLLRSLKELRLVLDSILGSGQALIWSVLLNIIVSYMFGVCFMQAAIEYVERGDAIGEVSERLLRFWGSLGRSMTSLLAASTGGDDWSSMADPLYEVGAHYYGFFLMYIVFFLFVVMNTVTSIFVESVREFSDRDQTALLQEQFEKKEEYMAKIIGLFRDMDIDDSGEVSLDEFTKHLRDDRMAAFAMSLQVDVSELHQFFDLLSASGQRTVDLETFVVGCVKLRGSARSMDMIDVLIRMQKLVDEHTEFAMSCRASFRELRELLANNNQLCSSGLPLLE